MSLARLLRFAGAAWRTSSSSRRTRSSCRASTPSSAWRPPTVTASASAGTAGWRHPGRLPQHGAGLERPQPARAVGAGDLGSGVRAHPGHHRYGGPADQLPSLPPRALALHAQRSHQGLPEGEAGPDAGRLSRAVPAHRGVDRLRAVLLPRAHLRAAGQTRRRGLAGRGRHRGGRAPARRGAPDPDDGGDHRRRDHVGVPLLQRGQVALAVPQRRRRDAAGAVPRQPGAAPALGRCAARGVRAAGRPARRLARGAGVHAASSCTGARSSSSTSSRRYHRRPPERTVRLLQRDRNSASAVATPRDLVGVRRSRWVRG